MKKYLLAGLFTLLGSAGAYAQSNATDQFCNGAVGGGNAITAATVSSPGFVVTAFTPKCSSNVVLNGQDNSTYYSVASASLKGKTIFIGSSAGGGVRAQAAACTGTAGACVAGDVTGANGIAAATAISS